MSVFPKNVLLKIVREAITSEYLSVCDARLVCKSIRDDAKIYFYFEQLKDLMRKWNIMREAVRRITYVDVVQNGVECRVSMFGLAIGNIGEIVMDVRHMSGNGPIFVVSYSHKTEEYVIKRPMCDIYAYDITDVFPLKRQKTSE